MSTEQTGKKQRRSGEICVLQDGTRVRYNLQKRDRDPCYRICFTGPNGKRCERSTKEKNRKRAVDAACGIIIKEYNPKPVISRPSWDEAIDAMLQGMEAENLRPGSIQQYRLAVNGFRKWTDVESPADVTPEMAQRYKAKRMKEVKPRTVRGNLENLSIVYGNWWKDTCKILACNPFEDVRPPKDERKPPRIISEGEQTDFLDWLKERWNNWRLPILFLEVKAKIGCRIGELAKADRANLVDGRIRFIAETTKGRKERSCMLPTNLFDELRGLSDLGTGFLFGPFSDQLREIHRKRGRSHHAKAVKDFEPKRLVDWLQNQAAEYFKATEAKRFKLHNFRGTAMSRARMNGVSSEDASVAFGCNPQTMREHYIAFDEVAVADSVMAKI